MADRLKVGVVGATGLVGREMLRVLSERRFPVAELRPLASARSAGQSIPFGHTAVPVEELTPASLDGLDLALFSAGAAVSREWAPRFAERGTWVIDNSSAFRMDPAVPLCVPEVNLDAVRASASRIIANPNCSTIQMVVALKPLHDEARIRRIVVSTYQAVSGAGQTAVSAYHAQLAQLTAGEPVAPGTLGGQLAGNLLMGWKVNAETGYQEEELKMIHETRKILGDESIMVSPTTVRVPVENAHSEAVAIETERPLSPARARELLERAPGVVLMDDFACGVYPTPRDASGRDEVFVGRVREDLGNPGGLLLWIVGDNLRKGAATNAVQIAEALVRR
jgi:aspartate-semialdehyde dehydrogenase